jgi:hypothetical protein
LDVSKNSVLEEFECCDNQFSASALNSMFEMLHGRDIDGGKTVNILGNPGTERCAAKVAERKGWNVYRQKITVTVNAERDIAFRIYAGGETQITVDWGDGKLETGTYDPARVYRKAGMTVSHTFKHYWSAAAAYTVTVTGGAITYFDCSAGGVTHLDVSLNPELTGLYCGDNRLTSLDVSRNRALAELYCLNNRLTDINLRKNTALTVLYCGGNLLSDIDVSRNTSLRHFDCGYNRIASLDLAKNTALTHLSCYLNRLRHLDVSRNASLTELFCSDNLLTALDVSRNTALTYLFCDDSPLTALDVSRNPSLEFLYLRNCNFSASALDELFETMHGNDFKYGKHAKISGNGGVKSCNIEIAERKGWRVEQFR